MPFTSTVGFAHGNVSNPCSHEESEFYVRRRGVKDSRCTAPTPYGQRLASDAASQRSCSQAVYLVLMPSPW